MIKGIGIDIIEIDRIKKAVKKYGRHFLDKVFTPNELRYCISKKQFRYPELSVRFAAKEAYAKALGVGISGFGRNNKGINWKEIEIANNSQGKPSLSIRGRKSKKILVSLSHSRDYAVASVYVEN